MTTTSSVLETAAADADAALARLSDVLGGLSDGDLHLAHPSGGWTAAQLVSHINMSALVWLAAMERVRRDPELVFLFREEVGHDLLGYPPPTIALAQRQLASTRRTLATCLPATGDVLDRTVEIPDLGTRTVAEWTGPIVGHLTGHVDHALDVLRSRGALPAEA